MIDEYLKMGSVVEEEFRIMNQHHHNYGSYRPQPQYIRENPKIYRNDPCVCGSGKKYKKCCK